MTGSAALWARIRALFWELPSPDGDAKGGVNDATEIS